MDKNKLAALRGAGYEIRATCGNCLSGEFRGNEEWSTCSRHKYEHEKHTGPSRHMSVHRAGHCECHRWKKVNVGLFKEFLKPQTSFERISKKEYDKEDD